MYCVCIVCIVYVCIVYVCILGINGVNPQYSGQNYRSAIMNYVNIIFDYNMAVILDLHWTDFGTNPSTHQNPMPDRDHAVEFWR